MESIDNPILNSPYEQPDQHFEIGPSANQPAAAFHRLLQTFQEDMRIVQALTARDFKMPTNAELPSPIHREQPR